MCSFSYGPTQQNDTSLELVMKDLLMVLEHLDRCFGNLEWVDTFPSSMVNHLNFWGSDHRPLLVKLKSLLSGEKCGKKRRVGKFQFERAWCDDPEYGEIIRSSWLAKGAGMSIRGIVDNIELYGLKLSSWGRVKFRHLNQEIRVLNDQMGCFFASINLDAWLALRNNENKLNDLLLSKKIYWRQHSRVCWLKDAD
ncbi:hypothetical protein UlMin_043769 [Ulmus minor]